MEGVGLLSKARMATNYDATGTAAVDSSDIVIVERLKDGNATQSQNGSEKQKDKEENKDSSEEKKKSDEVLLFTKS